MDVQALVAEALSQPSAPSAKDAMPEDFRAAMVATAEAVAEGKEIPADLEPVVEAAPAVDAVEEVEAPPAAEVETPADAAAPVAASPAAPAIAPATAAAAAAPVAPVDPEEEILARYRAAPAVAASPAATPASPAFDPSTLVDQIVARVSERLPTSAPASASDPAAELEPLDPRIQKLADGMDAITSQIAAAREAEFQRVHAAQFTTRAKVIAQSEVFKVIPREVIGKDFEDGLNVRLRAKRTWNEQNEKRTILRDDEIEACARDEAGAILRAYDLGRARERQRVAAPPGKRPPPIATGRETPAAAARPAAAPATAPQRVHVNGARQPSVRDEKAAWLRAMNS